MQRQLLILACRVHCGDGAQYVNEAKDQVRKELGVNLPKDLREQYHIVTFFFATAGESRIECIFPKDPDVDVVNKINELIDLQNKM